MMAVSYRTDPTFAPDEPKALFSTAPYYFDPPYGRPFDVAPDGRFLMIKIGGPEGVESRPSIEVVLNWVEELKARVPVP